VVLLGFLLRSVRPGHEEVFVMGARPVRLLRVNGPPRDGSAPVPAPVDRLVVWSVLLGVPTGELVRLWVLAATDGAPAAVVWDRLRAGLRGDVVKFQSGLPRPRIY
jgi:hypothetical protein